MLVSVFHHKAMRMSKVPVKKKHKLLFLELLPHGGEQTNSVNSVGKTRSDKDGKQSVMKKARWALHCNTDWEPILTASLLCVADLTDALVAEQEQKSVQPDSKIWRDREWRRLKQQFIVRRYSAFIYECNSLVSTILGL